MTRAPITPPADFTHSNTPDPHIERRKAILASHPEIKSLPKTYFPTLLWILFLNLIQLGILYLLKESSFIWTVFTAYTVGSVITLGMWILSHECDHGLVSKKKWVNIAGFFLTNWSLIFPGYDDGPWLHLKHHWNFGKPGSDIELPHNKEAWLFHRIPAGKWLYLHFMMFIQIVRALTIKAIHKKGNSKLYYLNWLSQLTYLALVWNFFGKSAILYLFVSLYTVVGLHWNGLFFIHQHFNFKKGQETFSFYGRFNSLAWNFGYHVEHHDFPNVPWKYLPEIKRLAPEFYCDLFSFRSLWQIFSEFYFNSNLGMYSRTVRVGKNRPLPN